MNTVINIRIDKKTKELAQKSLNKMGLDLSSGIKYYLSQVARTNSLSYICEYGYLHHYTKDMVKKMDKEVAYTLKHAKKYTSTKKMFDDIMKTK